jgi:hypothetical protein
MTLITDIRTALLARLGGITQADGYLTDAGSNVVSGWFNEVIQQQPIGNGLIVVQRANASLQPIGGDEAMKIGLAYSVIGAASVGLDDYESTLDALETDLLSCLLTPEGEHIPWLPKGCSGFEVGASEIYPPGDGQPAATVLVPVTVTAVISRQG